MIWLLQIVLLTWVVWQDIRTRLILHRYILMGIVLGAFAQWQSDQSWIVWCFGWVLGVIIGIVLFAMNAMGGGDSKLIIMLSTWFAWDVFLLVLVVMSLAGLIQIDLAKKQGRTEVPYGVSIAAGALVGFSVVFF